MRMGSQPKLFHLVKNHLQKEYKPEVAADMQPLWALTMTKKFTILFLLCLVLLIVSEYFLLYEIYSERRPELILISAMGLFISLVAFFISFRKYSEVAK
jgi:hypothetical protein